MNWLKFSSLALFATVSLRAFGPVPDVVNAAKSGDRGALQLLLEKHTDVDAAEPDGTTSLHWAVRANDIEMTELLLRAGAHVNVANRYGVTPLSLASENGNSVMVSILLKAGAEVAAADRNLADGQTVLMLAARSGNVETVEALLQHGSNVNATESRTGTTALMWAALEDQAPALRALQKAGAAINTESAITHYPHTPPGVVGDKLEEGVSYVGQTPLPKGGWTALMYAARQDSMTAAQALAETGADLDATDPEGTSALEIAIINGHYALATMLLDKGADPNLPDRTGMSPLYAAVDMHTMAYTFGRADLTRPVVEGSIGMIKTLLAHGADPNAKLKSRIVKRVYNAGDPKLGEGATAFMRAARGGDPEVMQILLEAGADPMLVQKNGNTPLMLAAGLHPKASDKNPAHGTEVNVLKAMQLCLERGIDVNAVNQDGDTAIYAALGSPGYIRFLADHGAKLDVKNRRGQTPLDVALRGREVSAPTVAALRELGATSGDSANAGAAQAVSEDN
jgi:uncharacterized protein